MLLSSAVLLLAACASALPPAKPPVNPDALWGIVQRDCPVDGPPQRSCLAINPHADRRDVVLKDSHGHYQFLLLPLDRVTGIESPVLLRADAPNYFAAAWQERWRTEQALGRPLPREVASLALNSPHGRSQHQLHIHVDCLRTDVLAQLQRLGPGITTRWQPLPALLRGHRYVARRLTGPELSENPVQLLANELAGAQDLGRWSLVVAGAHASDGSPGFVVLATQLDPGTGNDASGEELQDHACAAVTGADAALDGVR
ncbi:CDP-diacylglycerol diphosphatase [Bacillus subtilis subsp. subtilis]|nr:CDP-diacylglycerol diphosphatase [Bacillus subtilis subsp. subtilis]